jgi:hypothetical protein
MPRFKQTNLEIRCSFQTAAGSWIFSHFDLTSLDFYLYALSLTSDVNIAVHVCSRDRNLLTSSLLLISSFRLYSNPPS